MSFATNAGEHMHIDSSGNVGIGNEQDVALHIKRDAGSQTNYPWTQLLIDGADYNNDPQGIMFATSSTQDYSGAWIGGQRNGTANNGSGDLLFKTKNASGQTTTSNLSTRMLIDYVGRVGIGTTVPRNYLEIKQTAPSFSLNTAGSGGDTNLYWEIANATEWRFYTDGGNHRFYFMDNDSTMYLIERNDTSFNFQSDERLKEDISTISGGLDKINALRGVNFKWNEFSNKQTGENQLGFIAQEVKDHIPEAVRETQMPEHKGTELEDTYVMSRDTLLPVMVEAIKELSSKVTALENA